MRNNQPITKTETQVPEGVFIYSRTDLKGVITEANEAFAEISGFLPEQMVGQPHNLIRHPDMPMEAFADMWASLKQGKPWKGLVKNRRSDGGFYWVLANASPVREGGKIVGYQSVRSKPTRDQIDAAEKAYARIRSGDKSLRVQDGRITRNLSPWVERLISHQSRLYGFVVLALLTEVSASVVGWLPDMRWLAIAHECTSAVMLASAVYMLLYYLPKALGRLKTIDAYLQQTLIGGDFTASLVPTKNDIIGSVAAKLDTQIAAVRATLQIIADSTREVSATAQSLGDSVEALVGSASQQTATTTAAAAGVEQITVAVGEVAQYASNTQGVAQEARGMARDGASLSEQASAMIETLANTVASSVETVEQLGRRTDEVSKVASVIKDIADQTNLLALNAAIEAARAGEQGRGFAVVADEVRKLAERTALATREIDQMIVRIQADTISSVDGMRHSVDQVGQSVSLVQRAHGALQSINVQMDNTLQMVSEISHSSSEQSEAITAMAQSVEHVAQLTEENLAIAHRTEHASQTLLTNVGRVGKAVAQYKV